ncbi:phosphohydrolase [bacterium]|nr:phosphohydrolase [bacterium]
MNTLNITIILFVIATISGWFLEFFFRAISNKKLMNPGFLNGPFLPIYGFGASLVFLVKINFSDNLVSKIAIYFIAMTMLELITGFFVHYFFKIRLWDYSENSFNLNGYICPKYSITFTVLAIILDAILSPVLYYMNLIYDVTIVFSLVIFYAILVVVIVDFIISCAMKFYKMRNRLETEEQLREQFLLLAEPILNHPDVAKLSEYNHHGGKTRLDHVKDVAWLSFKVAKYFSLNLEETVRAAILHDLFYYDWLREGPRLHGFRHPKIAKDNAVKIFELSEREKDIILKHMFPLTIIPPKYSESWIVCFVDTYCSIREYVLSFMIRLNNKGKSLIDKFR